MRIISGFLKGRSIKYIRNSNTRPLKDNVKENIFNILQHSNLIKTKIENSNILDLYSGVGSFGIECISRGANKVTFIDQDASATNILRENLINLSIINKSKIILNKIENILYNDLKQSFDIFFLDPPFSYTDYFNDLKIIKQKKIFKKKHITIIHRENKSNDEFNDLLEIIETKKYGRSKIIFGLFK